MKTIGQAIPVVIENSEVRRHNQCSQHSSKTSLEKQYGDFHAFCDFFDADKQTYFAMDDLKAVMCDAPTLKTINDVYPGDAAAAWITLMIDNLTEFSGCKQKLSALQLSECATIISCKFSYLKVTEVMLFFLRFKMGYYGKFFGSADPMQIIISLRSFLSYRNGLIADCERILNQKKNQRERSKAVSYEEYLLIKAKTPKTHSQSVKKTPSPTSQSRTKKSKHNIRK